MSCGMKECLTDQTSPFIPRVVQYSPLVQVVKVVKGDSQLVRVVQVANVVQVVNVIRFSEIK